MQKALRCSVFGVRFSEKPVSCTENCLLKTENWDFAKVLSYLKRNQFWRNYEEYGPGLQAFIEGGYAMQMSQAAFILDAQEAQSLEVKRSLGAKKEEGVPVDTTAFRAVSSPDVEKATPQ